jgi:hypothetical protein
MERVRLRQKGTGEVCARAKAPSGLSRGGIDAARTPPVGFREGPPRGMS